MCVSLLLCFIVLWHLAHSLNGSLWTCQIATSRRCQSGPGLGNVSSRTSHFGGRDCSQHAGKRVDSHRSRRAHPQKSPSSLRCGQTRPPRALVLHCLHHPPSQGVPHARRRPVQKETPLRAGHCIVNCTRTDRHPSFPAVADTDSLRRREPLPPSEGAHIRSMKLSP